MEFFADKEGNDDNSLIRNKSKFTPKRNRNNNLEQYIDNISKFPLQTNLNVRQNISKAEKLALKRLQDDKSIIIKQADKGGAIVIMSSDYYQGLAEDQLSDTSFYSEIPENIDNRIMRRLTHLVTRNENSLTEKEADALINFSHKTSNFYGLPKIHKSTQIQSAVNLQGTEYIKVNPPTDLKLRPIIAGPVCPTHRLSNLIDIILKPLCTYVPSFIRDDIDFLSHLPENAHSDSILVSFYVTSLYTNIPHDLGIEAMKFWIEKHRDAVPERFSNDFILESVRFILENNSFFFNGKNYLQIKGTAMGTKFAPTYATLVMGYLEQKLYRTMEQKHGMQFALDFEKSWKRFLDDCFIIWTHGNDQLSELTELLNNLHPSIKFTQEVSNTQLPFLDILVELKDEKITTDIYYKNTDTHQYLNFNSCHPSHTKRNIPYCLARKICTVIKEPNLRDVRLEELSQFLLKQKYPRTIIQHGIERAKNIPIETLRTTVNRTSTSTSDNDIIPFVVTHNPSNPNIFNIAKANLPILRQSEKLKDLITPNTLIQSKRQPPNLKRLLTKARFDPKGDDNPIVSPCNDNRCGTCKHIFSGNEITSKDGTKIYTNANMNCKSSNLIYCIKCPNCEEIYIGQTGNALSERMRVHRQQVREAGYRQIPLSAHIETCGGGNFFIFPFYKMKSPRDTLRELKERNFIKKFRPVLNGR